MFSTTPDSGSFETAVGFTVAVRLPLLAAVVGVGVLVAVGSVPDPELAEVGVGVFEPDEAGVGVAVGELPPVPTVIADVPFDPH